MSADTVINAAKFAWDVIKDGKPTADITGSTANAVPQVQDWQSLTGAQGPSVYTLPISYGFNWPLDDYDHVQIQLKLKWQFGAKYQNGGAFIPNIWIEVPDCYVGWPWNVNISMIAHNPTNAGTAKAPIAQIPLTLRGSISSFLESQQIEWSFMLFGDGRSSVS